jgi:hypothetical protein
MNVGFKIGLAALGAGAVGAFGGKVVGGEGDNRLAGLGIAGVGAGIGSIAAITSGAPKWSAGVMVAAAGVGYLLGSTIFGGGAGEGVKHLAPGPHREGDAWDRAIRDLGRGMRLPEREFVPDNPAL